MFANLGIGEDLVRAAIIRRVTDAEAREWGFKYSSSSDLAGIVFPYIRHEGKRATARLRRDRPDVDEKGRPKAKYISEFGGKRIMYVPPGTYELLLTTPTCLVIVEAEKSALAITALAQRTGRALAAIASGGCYGWKGRIGKEPSPKGGLVDVNGPLPDLAGLAAGREIIICFDSNAATNENVRRARRELARHLNDEGSTVRIAEIPAVDGVNGPDDLIAMFGDHKLLAVLDSARTFNDSAVLDAEAAVAALTPESTVVEQQDVFQLIAEIADPGARRLLAESAKKRLKITDKGAIRREIDRNVKILAQRREQAGAAIRRAELMRVQYDIREFFADLTAFFSKRVYLPEGAAAVLALWATNTWLFDAFKTVPYLLLESATKGCGKTTVLELLEYLCRCPERATAVTEAVLFRLIERDQPTLLIDEAELFMGRSERADCIRAVANAGYKRGGAVPRCDGENNEIRKFPVYCPKAFAAIGGLEGALADRCIVIRLEKAPPDFILASTRESVLTKEAAPLRDKLEAYAMQGKERLIRLYENEPDEGYWPHFRGREAELWTPLLTNARLLGAEIEREAVAAAKALSTRKQQRQAEERDFALATELLAVLERFDGDVSPADLAEHLVNKDTWGACLERLQTRGRATAIGKFLRQHGLSARHDRVCGSVYDAEVAKQALIRNLPYELQPQY